jgi:hypothetical protein
MARAAIEPAVEVPPDEDELPRVTNDSVSLARSRSKNRSTWYCVIAVVDSTAPDEILEERRCVDVVGAGIGCAALRGRAGDGESFRMGCGRHE